jgi:hypothetical protein
VKIKVYRSLESVHDDQLGSSFHPLIFVRNNNKRESGARFDCVCLLISHERARKFEVNHCHSRRDIDLLLSKLGRIFVPLLR